MIWRSLRDRKLITCLSRLGWEKKEKTEEISTKPFKIVKYCWNEEKTRDYTDRLNSPEIREKISLAVEKTENNIDEGIVDFQNALLEAGSPHEKRDLDQ